MQMLVLADTHIKPGWKRRLPDSVYAELRSSDAVLHAGDVVHGVLLDELAAYAPTYAVLGNNDEELARHLPERQCLALEGIRIGMVHDSGPKKGRPRRLRRWFPDADLVVYGHSHEGFSGPGEDGQWLFNPGSPTVRKRAPAPTFGVLELDAGRIVRHELITCSVPPPYERVFAKGCRG